MKKHTKILSILFFTSLLSPTIATAGDFVPVLPVHKCYDIFNPNGKKCQLSIDGCVVQEATHIGDNYEATTLVPDIKSYSKTEAQVIFDNLKAGASFTLNPFNCLGTKLHDE
jgi:hypothetical protein